MPASDTTSPRRARLRKTGKASEDNGGPSQPQYQRSSTGRRRSGRHSAALADDDVEDEVRSTEKNGRPRRRARQSGDGNREMQADDKRSGPEERDNTAAEAIEDPEDRRQREQKERELYERWAEEYYEIVEQLPMELHRTFTLMRELEGKVQNRLALVASHATAYRDARKALKEFMATEQPDQPGEQGEHRMLANSREQDNHNGETTSTGRGSEATAPSWVLPGPSSDADAEGERDDEAIDLALTAGAASVSSETANAVDNNLSEPNGDSHHTKMDSHPMLPNNVPTRAARLALLDSVARASAEAIRAADEKVGLAVTAYDWVDRHIRRLDADLQKSESSLLLGLRAGTEASRGLQDALGLTQAGTDQDGGTNPAQKRQKASHSQSPGLGLRTGEDEGLNSFVGDMAIDPNEPKYCYCDQVSFGDMIACDNEDCPREWFHYECVGLLQPPKGKWFCLFCAPPGYKGSGTFPPHAPCLPASLQSSHAAASGRGKMAKRETIDTHLRPNGASTSAIKSNKSHVRSNSNVTRNHVRGRTSSSNPAGVRVQKRKV